jgi:hypothetical protein
VVAMPTDDLAADSLTGAIRASTAVGRPQDTLELMNVRAPARFRKSATRTSPCSRKRTNM